MTDSRRAGKVASVPEKARGTDTEPVSLPVVDPSIERDAVESAGRVGAVAYPYRVVETTVRVPRPVLSDREDSYVVSVDRTRRLALRADEMPSVDRQSIRDVLVVDPVLDGARSTEKAREAAFEWTLRTHSPGKPPTVAVESTVDAHKLFWLAERPEGDVIVDSVRGTERPLED